MSRQNSYSGKKKRKKKTPRIRVSHILRFFFFFSWPFYNYPKFGYKFTRESQQTKKSTTPKKEICQKKCILVSYTLFLPCFLASGVERLISGNSYSITHF